MTTNPRLPEFDENSPLRPARFGHIVVRTRRFKQMAPWYKALLNAEALFELPNLVFLTYNDEHHRVLVVQNPAVPEPAEDEPPRQPEPEGIAHWAYLFDSLTDLMSAYARLRDKEGITPAYCTNHGFQYSLYYKDPDGNEVELGCDVFQTRDELNAWFENGLFAKNFIGFNFDPEDVFRWMQQGESEDKIFENTYRGDVPDLSAFLEAQS